MPAARLKKAMASRRRPEDEGEEEGSDVGMAEDDSLSEPSAISNGDDDDADIDGTDISLEDIERSHSRSNGQSTKEHDTVATLPSGDKTSNPTNNHFKQTADTEAMLNGLKLSDKKEDAQEEMQFDDLVAGAGDTTQPTAQDGTEKLEPHSAAERNRQEHQEYLKQRDSDPAFVPNRGGFFLHDDRSIPAAPQAFRGSFRGRGRGSFNGVYSGRAEMLAGPTDRQWAHDLHESVATTEAIKAPLPISSVTTQPASVPQTSRSAATSAPNRSFSTTIVLGNVVVQVFLPGMSERITVPNVVKKQHTLLPQHRPPLRRDKPVRISIPDHSPRYIFPSTERSFIFIPRAMRPNQSYVRGRGRGSFHGSRRTSMFGGSTYSPSIAMSRKSSQGGFVPPNGHMVSAPTIPDTLSGKPIVRLPMGTTAINGQISNPPFPPAMPQEAFARDNQAQTLPMHQPRPQKNVSVADIETPASFTFNPPQQQQEQPFHQQVPLQVQPGVYGDQSMILDAHSRHASYPNMHNGTPLSHIPEQAIYAQPFQPFPLMQAPPYMTAPYAPAMFYPPINANGNVAPIMMAPTFVPGAAPPYMYAPPPQQHLNEASQTNMVAHESNGMVYYYDPSQMSQGQQEAHRGHFGTNPPGGVIGMGGMMTPPTQPFYAPNGVYYAPHQT